MTKQNAWKLFNGYDIWTENKIFENIVALFQVKQGEISGKFTNLQGEFHIPNSGHRTNYRQCQISLKSRSTKFST